MRPGADNVKQVMHGHVTWEGYFQPVRPSPSSGYFYQVYDDNDIGPEGRPSGWSIRLIWKDPAASRVEINLLIPVKEPDLFIAGKHSSSSMPTGKRVR